MRVMVTGGSGYFGSMLVSKLLSAGHQCSVLDIVDADDRPSDVEFFAVDVRDADAVQRAIRRVDVIYHNVAQVPLAKDRHLFESVNVTGTRNLLAAALAAGVKKVVYTSSSAVFGKPRYNPVTEETPALPGESYGRAKYEGEELCRTFAKQGLDVTIMRPRTILGHGRLGIFQILFEWIKEGANVPVLGSGNNRYQFIHADDMANACILAANKPGFETFNCGTDRFGTMREALENLCRHAGTGSRVKSLPMAPAELAMKITSRLGLSPLGAYHSLMYGHSMYFDIAKAQSLLDWQPRYSNDEMLAESYDWYLSHRDEVLRGRNASHHRSGMRQGVLRLVKQFL